MKRALPILLFAAAAAHARDLPCGVPVDGYLPPPANVIIDAFNPQYTTDVYSVQAEAGEAILIRFVNLSTSDTSFRPRLIVRNPGASVVPPRTTRLGSGATSAAEYVLADAGEYRVEVGATNITPGNYRITMVRLNRPCAAATLSCGVAVSGQVSGTIDVKTYRADVKANDVVSFRWTKTGPFAVTTNPPEPNPPPAPAATAVQMFVFGPDGVLMTQTNNALAAAEQSRNRIALEVKSPVSGALTVVVFDRLNNTASYSLSASRLNGACGDRPLICGTPIDSTLKAAASVDGFVVSAQAGDVFSVRLGRADTSGQFLPTGEIYDQSGKLISTVTAAVTSPHAVAVGTFTASTAGTYTVLAADGYDGSKNGGYTIALNRLNRPCSTNSLGCATVATGNLSGLLRANTYSFEASANDAFLLRILNAGDNRRFRPRLDVYDPQGNVVQTTSTYDIARVNFITPSSGVYTAVISDSYDSAQPGSYALSSFRLNRPCTSTAIDCGKVMTGAIDGVLKVSAFTYTAAAGESFGVRLLSSTGGLQPDVEIYDPAGVKIGASISGNVRGLDVVKPAAGPYTIVAYDSNQTPGQGAFTLELLRTRNACGTAPGQGQSVGGVVSGVAPFVSYTIPVGAGDVLNLRSVSFTSGFSALMEVYDQDGARADQGTYSITRRVSAPGSYTVLVSASNPSTAGAYTFSWQLLNNPTAASSLLCGATAPGVLSSSNAFRYYLAGLESNDIAKFLLTPASDNFSPRMEVYDPLGNRLGATGGELQQRVTRNGNYLVVLTPETATGATGTYSVSLQRPNNPCNVTTLACGQSVLRAVDGPGQIDAYSFTGATGDLTTLRLPVRSGSYSPFGELYNASGTLLRGFSSGALNYLLPADGKYTLLVRDRNGVGTGAYRTALQTDPACPVEDSQAPTIALVRPTGGEVIAGGAPFHIAWKSDDNVDVASHEVRLSTDGGVTFPTVVASGLSGSTQSYEWTVPATIAPTRTAVLQVSATDSAGNTQSAASDLLTVIGAGFTENVSATVTYDGLGRVTEIRYSDGRTVTYTWDAQGNLVNVAVAGQ
jgi:YD repeat-containing protein